MSSKGIAFTRKHGYKRNVFLIASKIIIIECSRVSRKSVILQKFNTL